MAYAVSTPELDEIETDADKVTDALNAASSLMDSRFFAIYETPIVTVDTGDLARLKRWSLAIAAYYLTAMRPGSSEKVEKDYETAIKELEQVRSGSDRLVGVTMLEAPVLVRSW